MKQGIFTIIENTALNRAVFRLRLRGDTTAVTAPGQFVNIRLEGRTLRRPFSVCDVQGDVLTVIYKAVGQGTEQLTRLWPGVELDILTGLGNGFDLSLAGERPLLAAGGVGLTPLVYLAKTLTAAGKEVSVVLGFNTKEEVLCADEFRALGCKVTVTTVDGSYGVPGFVTDALPEDYTYFYACGPEPMLKALCAAAKTSGQLSFESRMGCGFGACMGCSCQTMAGSKRICRDGPVLRREELLW